MYKHNSYNTVSSWILSISIFGLFVFLFSFSRQKEFESALANIGTINQIDPVGENFRISDMGPDGDTTYSTFTTAIAYNSLNNEYLVVWHGDDNSNGLVQGEFEIFGQRIDGGTGDEIGSDFQISDMGGIGIVTYDALAPSVAYNSITHEYLVVWYGDDNVNGLVDNELEIFGQRIGAATGLEIGENDFQISQIGGIGVANYDASYPDVVFNPIENEFFVVWQANNIEDSGTEIYFQRIDGGTGLEVGEDTRVSDMGPEENNTFGAITPAITFNSIINEYLVVWEGDDNINGLIVDEQEIFGQRLNGVAGSELGENDFRISFMGPDGDTGYEANTPALTFNPDENEYLVVWSGDNNLNGQVETEYEIFGQKIDGLAGNAIGDNIALSDMGDTGIPAFDGFTPKVKYSTYSSSYLVTWRGDDNVNGLVDNEDEIFGQELDGLSGGEIGENDFRISFMGPDGDDAYNTIKPALAYNPADYQYLVIWVADDNVNGLVDNEDEVFGQRLQLLSPQPTRTPTPSPTASLTTTPTPPPSTTHLYLPLLLRPIPCLPAASLETEPNDSSANATGPLCLNQDYPGLANNGGGNWDYYFFTLPSAGTFTVDMTNHPLASENGAQVLLYYQTVSTGNLVGGPDTLPPYQLTYTGAAGTYYIVLYNDISKCGPLDCDQNYVLRVTHP